MRRRVWRTVTLRVLFAALLGVPGCAKEPRPVDPAGDLIARGLTLMHQASDPVSAEAVFREVLQRNPSHYGARYQLAVALDRGGKPAEARIQWQQVMQAAQAIHDTITVRSARARLEAPDTASQAAMMALGVDLLHRQGDAQRAMEEFRRVLSRNPAHYGATYQLAAAHDRLGERGRARPYWQRVRQLAESFGDTAVAQAARARLLSP